MGRPVRIRTMDGNDHHGIITRVSPTHVYLRPMPPRNVGGRFGYGYGLWWGFGLGFGIGIALGAIVGIALVPWGWW